MYIYTYINIYIHNYRFRASHWKYISTTAPPPSPGETGANQAGSGVAPGLTPDDINSIGNSIGNSIQHF